MPPSLTIDAVLWDLSGVLTVEAVPPIEGFSIRCGLDVHAWMAVFNEYCVREHAWDQVERGELGLDDFATELSGRIVLAGGECAPGIARTLWGDPDPFGACAGVRNELFATVEALRRNRKSALCTNNVAEWREAWNRLIPVRAFFDHVFDSSAMGCRKPEPAFFRAVEGELGFGGRRVLLIDDRAENILAANADAQWCGIHFIDTTALESSLRAYGLLDTPTSTEG